MISSYIVRRKLGSGGMGDVYLCDDPSLGRKVAVKVMHRLESDDPEAVSRFILEGKALAKLTHPNIVSVYGLGEESGILYIAMEHVQGQSLFQHSRDRKLSITEMIGVFCDVANGLDHAHSAGIVHRDIKPANILVDNFGRGKIIDFGIAKAVGNGSIGPEGVKTKTGVVIGTLNYIAPELFRGDPPSPLSDIYALGLCFFEMLTGRTPFKAESQFSTMEKIRAGDLEVPDNLRLLLPNEFWKVLYQMIAADPAERTMSAAKAANALKEVKLVELPRSWAVPMASVRIENLDALQVSLEEKEIDPAEWQFILSSALKRQSERPRTGHVDLGGAEASESTSFLETTGIVLLPEILDEAVESYRIDLQQILTSRRLTRFDGLTPPPLKPIAASPTYPGPITAPQSIPTDSAAPQGFNLKWVTAIVLVAACLIGFSQYQRWQKDLATKAALVEAQKALDAKAARLNSQRGEKVSAPVAKRFAMVIEPNSDAWPPVEWREPEAGVERTWSWSVRNGSGKVVKFEESRSFVSTEGDLLKFLVRSKMDDGATITSTEWYQPGFLGLPRRTSASVLFGGLGGTVVGQPELLFPLRKGKEVHFELDLNQVANAGYPTIMKIGSVLKARGSCIVGDKVDGSNAVVRTNCSFKTDSNLELSLAMNWSSDRRDLIKTEFRIVDSSSDKYEVTTIVGQEVAESVAAIRAPTSN